MEGAGYLAVARFSKPHGLKGEALVFVLTDRPEQVFVPGRVLMPLDAAGRPAGRGWTIERARAYHRRWLIKFAGLDDRTPLEGWGRVAFGIPSADAPAGPPGEFAAHEVPGVAVVRGSERVGTAIGLIPVPGGSLLAVDVAGREVLIPFRPPIVVRVDRERRQVEIDPPAGLLEL